MQTIFLIVMAMGALAYGQELKDRETYKLWPGRAPGQEGDEAKDIPVVQAFLPAEGKATGASFVVCPGGGYGGLANHEGPVVGEWFAKHGVTAFVLRYRLGPKYHHPIELGDAQRAIRFVRFHSADWKLDPKRIGIIGFSAGGHLASTTATHFDNGMADATDPVDKVSCRPDLQVLVYPVITMHPGGHAGSRQNLLGSSPSAALVDELSSEKQVKKDTPPAFLVHSTQDKGVPVGNSDMYAGALYEAGVPYEYIRGPMGGHGFGLTKDWTPQCMKWLADKGWAHEEESK